VRGRHHGHGGETNALHGHSTEHVRQLGTDEKARNNHGLKERELGGGNFSTHGVCGEEGEGNEGSGADGEALAVGGSGVAGGVEGVSALTHVLTELAHLSNATGVVADGAVSVDGEADGEGGEHAEGGHAMMATPYWEASLKEMHTGAARARTRARTGTMVDCMPRAGP